MKFALVVSGSPGSLLYIEQSAINVKDTINKYTEFKAHYEPLESRATLSDYLSTVTEKIDEFIFYYIGHGDIHYADKDKFQFEISKTQKDSLESIISTITQTVNPQKIFIIVDACKSGRILNDLDSALLHNTLLFPSCSASELSYECDTLKSTRFSSFFCLSLKDTTVSHDFYQIEASIIKQFESVNSAERQNVKMGDYRNIGVSLLKKDIKTEQPPQDQKLFLTIQLHQKEPNVFTSIIWAKSKDGTYLKNIASRDEDNPLKKTEIAQYIENCINEQYVKIDSTNIYLIFVIPSTLMTENINSWKLDSGKELGQRYTVITRALERFTSDGVNFKKDWYRHVDWEKNWEKCDKMNTQPISAIKHSITDDKQALSISSQRASRNPLIILNYSVGSNSFISLYKSHISIAMWINGCEDYKKFEDLLESTYLKDKEFGKLVEDFFEFKPNETGLKGNIMLLYDNPNDLPPDELKRINAETPKGETNDN